MITTPFYFFHSQYPVFTVLFILITIVKYKKSFFLELKKVFVNRAILLLACYFLYTYLSLLWTEDIEHGFTIQKVYREALFYIPILYLFLDKQKAEVCIKLLTISFGVYALYSIGFYLELYNSYKLNLQGTLGYETISVMMSLGIFFSLIFFYFEKNKNYKYMYVIIFILCTFAFSVNNGRAAQLSFILVVLTLVLIYWKKIYSLKFILVLLTAVSIFVLVIYNNSVRFSKGIDELKKVVIEKKFEGSWGIRAYMYLTGLKIIEKNPIFGTGAGDSKQTYREISFEENSPHSWFSHMHNQHIEILSRYGLIGYFLLIVSIVYLLFSIKKEKKFFMLGLVFYLSIFYNSFFNTIIDRKPIYILFFVLFALFSIVNKKDFTTKIK